MLLFLNLALAQEFPIYPDLPAKEAYKQIETPMFRLIYPESTSELAFDLANMLDHYTPQVRLQPFKPIDIVVQPYMATSNGFVAYAPRRSVFFTMPYMSTDPSKMGTSLSWNLALSIHEMQHVEQQDRVYHSGGVGAYVLSGEAGWAVTNVFSQPIWFAEGEAVMTETQMSPSGRGRTFGFVGESIALYDHSGPLSYSESYFGSFKMNVVDHYRIGWIMTDYGYQQYGENFWPAISRTSASNAFRFFPFEKAMYNTTGMRFQAWHDRSIEAQLKAWRTANQEKPSSDVTVIYEDESPFPAKFNSPVRTSKGQLIALRSAAEQISDVVQIQDGTLTGSFSVGQRNASNIAADDRFVVWDAFIDHPLHTALRYSDLFVYDQQSNTRRRLSRKGYFFSPALGPNHQLVAIQNTPQGQSALAFFTPSAGGIQEPDAIIPAPSGFLYDPHWESDKHILLIRREDTKGNILCRYHIDTGTFEDIGNWTWNVLSHPTSNDDWIFVVESLKYSDDVIGIPKAGGPSRTVAHRPYGLRDPYYDSTTNQLLMSEITHTGSRIVALELKPETWPLRPQSPQPSQLTIPEKDWSPKPYRAVKGLVKPYMWLPTIGIFQSDLNIDITAQDPTARWSLTQGLRYNINKQGLWGQTILTANRPWPNLSLESHYGRRSERDLNQVPEQPPADFKLSDLPTQEWREHQLLLGMEFPVSWSTSTKISTLSLQLKGGLQSADDLILSNGLDKSTLEIPLGLSYPIQGQLSLRQLAVPSTLDIFPRLGIKADIGHTHLMAETNSQNSYVSSQLFLPGLLPRNHLLLYAAAEQRLGPYPLVYQTRQARGHTTEGTQVFNASSSYIFPIAYPDLEWRRLLYIKRIRSGAFTDYMWTDKSMWTYGMNLTFDVHLMRLPVMIPIGIDYGYTLNPDGYYIGPSIDILY